MLFFEKILEYWVPIVLILIAPYSSYFLWLFYKKITTRKSQKKENSWYDRPITSEEQKHLGISILNSDPEKYKERIEKLIINLHECKDVVSINAIEAIMIVELFSESVLINEAGELVIDAKTAKKFLQIIYHDPLKFIRYIKAVESKLDLAKDANKIDFADVLYMMRNAKKFGLHLEKEETELTYKIKSAIHTSGYNDVTIRVVDDVQEFEDDGSTRIILTNTFLDNIAIKKIEPFHDSNIAKAEILEGGKVKITMKNGTVTIKDDNVVYSRTEPVIVEEKESNTQFKKEVIENIVATLAQKEDTKLQDYISRFGKLDAYEEDNKKDFKFRDRSLRTYDEQLSHSQYFQHEDFKTKNFFKNKDVYMYFLAKLLDPENAILSFMPHVFIGTITPANKEPFRYVSIDIHYFLNFVYMAIKRDDRESFFKFIYDGKTLRQENVNLFLKNINDEYDILFQGAKGYLNDVVYVIDGKTIKTVIVRIKTAVFQLFLAAEENTIKRNYVNLKAKIDGRSASKAFGVNAKKSQADITYGHDTFYRVPLTEKAF
ncbi:MAG: hypothetical protein NTW78_02005 [Campylobacterales bacterium]|nr:hypothetical protein [Campylobacterales bacterium]